METIRVMYEYDEGTWRADSPDFETLSNTRLFAGDDTYEAARARIEDLMPWALEREDIIIEHFVHANSVPAMVAEQRAETPPATTAAAKA